MYLELIPHPESKVEALALEELLRSLHGHGEALVYIVEYDGVHLKFLLGVPERLASSVAKSLQGVYGKLAVREAGEPDLKRYGWVAELRLRKPFYHVLVTHRRDSPLDLNPMDVLASTITGSPCATRIVAAPAPEEARVAIGEYTYAAKQGIPESTVEAVLRDLASFDESGDVRVCKPPEEEIREAELKMRSTLWTCRIQVFAGDPETARRVASAFNQFPGNQFTFRVRRARPEDYEVSIPKISRFLGLWVDKKAVVLSERELALFINLPSSFHHLPVRHSSLMLEPPPELAKLGVEEKHLGVKDLRELAGKGIVLLGFYGGKGYGLDLEEFMRSHKAIFGTTGAGKSSFARYVMLSYMLLYGPGNISIVYVDPNGDDALKLVKMMPEEFVDRLIYIDPRTIEFCGKCVRLNPIEYKDDNEREQVVQAFLAAMQSIFRQQWGKRLEDMLRNALKLVTSAPPGEYSLMDVLRVLTNEGARSKFLNYCRDEEVFNYFVEEFEPLVKKNPEAVNAVANKLRPILGNRYLRAVFGAKRSTVDLQRALDEGYVIVVNMGGLKGLEGFYLFGCLFLAKVLSAIYARAYVGEEARTPTAIFVDELHNFVGPALADMISQMLAETRKYNAFFVLMTQYPGQLPKKLRSALYELTDVFCFKVGLETASEVAELFAPWLGEQDLIGMPRYHYVARVRLGEKWLRPFTVRAPYVPVSIAREGPYRDPAIRERIERSLEAFGSEPGGCERARGPEVKPRALALAYAVYRRGGEARLGDLVGELGEDIISLAELVKEAASQGLVTVEGDAVKLTEAGRGLLDVSTRHGGEVHRALVERVARELLERGCYVDVDQSGGEDRPDIVAYEPVGDGWSPEPICVEVEAEPEGKTTVEKLARILARCHGAGCGRVVIVVPDEAGAEVVRRRLEELRKRAGKVAIAVGVPRSYVEGADVEVRVVPAPGAGEGGDALREFLAWLAARLDELTAAGAVAVRDGHAFITNDALRLFEEEAGRRPAKDLKALAEALGGKYMITRVGGKAVRAVKVPLSALESA